MLQVPCDFICCTGSGGIYRKPAPGMWELLRIWRCPNADMSQSLYVGDAAGRPKTTGRGKDFSDTDLKFALNMKIEFKTPEHFFLGSTDPYHTHMQIPTEKGQILAYMEKSSISSTTTSYFDNILTPPVIPELVILVAPPACGKSTVSAKFADSGYTVVNQDTLKTFPKCMAIVEQTILVAKRSVIVDNTNTERGTRAKWVEFAKKNSIPVRCILLETDKELSFLLASFRLCSPNTSSCDRRKIPSMAVHTMYKNISGLSCETLKMEGFDRVDNLGFALNPPKDEVERYLYNCYLL